MTVWQFWHGFMSMHVTRRDRTVNTCPETELTAEVRTNRTYGHPFHVCSKTGVVVPRRSEVLSVAGDYICL